MDTKPTILGFFILDCKNPDAEGFGDTTLKALFDQGHQNKLPLVNREKIRRLYDKSVVKQAEVRAVKAPLPFCKLGWRPTSRFLYQMLKTERYEELKIPKDCLLIKTNRKTIRKLVDTFRQPNPEELPLKVKLLLGKYGKELSLTYNNLQEQKKYHDGVSKNTSYGLNFNSFILDCADVEKAFTLFSIHAIRVAHVCFIYEAEIDAIEDIEKTGNYSLIEVKTNNKKSETQTAFLAYKAIHGNKNSKRQQLTREFSDHILQGELGNVNKFIYGFTMKGRVTAGEFPCFPASSSAFNSGTLLASELNYLNDFVDLLKTANIENMETFAEYEHWVVSKDTGSTKLSRSGEILGALNNWTNVKRKQYHRKK